MLHIRWNSQVGCIYMDGSHMKVCLLFCIYPYYGTSTYRRCNRSPQHDLELGDEIMIDGHAPILKLFENSPSEGIEGDIFSKK